jgi:bacillithiol biosynthesis deacetylase BshB1
MAEVVCVGAHPDDVEIGMGATVAQLVDAGVEVLLVDLTDGEPTPRGDHDTRMGEARASAAVLGVRRLTLDLPNRELFDDVRSRKMLAEVLRFERPTTVFAPYPLDSHPDHVAASAICEAARFYAKFVKTDMTGEPHHPAKLYHYWAVHLRVLEKPSFVIDATAGFERKLRALANYESQFGVGDADVGVMGWVRSQAGAWGSLIGVKAGEAFYAREQIGVRDVRDLI